MKYSYVFGIADRQNDNVMLRPSGQLFHIDFGHILGNYKRKTGLLRGSAPFVVTRDFENVIVAAQSTDNNNDDNNNINDNSMRTTKWQEFVSLGARAFAIVCRNATLFVALFSLMLPARLPELQSISDLKYLENILISTTNNNDIGDDSTMALERRWEKLIHQESFASTTITNLMHIVRQRSNSIARSSSDS